MSTFSKNTVTQKLPQRFGKNTESFRIWNSFEIVSKWPRKLMHEDAGERGYDRGVAPFRINGRATWADVLFNNSMIGNLIIDQDRSETNLLRLFAHPGNSKWFSIIAYWHFCGQQSVWTQASIIGNKFFICFHCPKLFYCPTATASVVMHIISSNQNRMLPRKIPIVFLVLLFTLRRKSSRTFVLLPSSSTQFCGKTRDWQTHLVTLTKHHTGGTHDEWGNFWSLTGTRRLRGHTQRLNLKSHLF